MAPQEAAGRTGRAQVSAARARRGGCEAVAAARGPGGGDGGPDGLALRGGPQDGPRRKRQAGKKATFNRYLFRTTIRPKSCYGA